MILRFEDIRSGDLARVGGKGLNLGLLSAASFPVPPGFCVTTQGFAAFLQGCAARASLYQELDAVYGADVEGARRVGEHVRATLAAAPMPAAVAGPVREALARLGAHHAYAVRSSATAEDLPGASFAGQQDTYLNVRGEAALLDAVRRCWISLFTDRAILYRARGGFGHRGVALCVVVQRMVAPEAAGILFTADPVSGHRGTVSIDAGFGLGEALVGGLVTADLYRVDRKSGALREVRVGDKALAIRALPGGGTEQVALSETQRRARVLTDEQVRALVELGVRVEAHYQGVPQDIEWCLEGGRVLLVQARPITSLFPLVRPQPRDGATHVYFSFSHAQNMTDPMSPMGQDLFRQILPFGKRRIDEIVEEPTVMVEAGGRLYIDVTSALRVAPLRRGVLMVLGKVYPELAAAVGSFAQRAEVQAAQRPSGAALRVALGIVSGVLGGALRRVLRADLTRAPQVADQLLERHAAELQAQVQAAPAGAPRLREVQRVIAGVFARAVQIPPLMAAGLISLGRLRKRFAGTPHAADVEALQRGLLGNVTTEMDLQVGDLADQARPYPDLIAALREVVARRRALEELRGITGGPEFLQALERFLERFGMRCAGEIDVGRARWREQPGVLLASVVGNLARPEARSHRAHFERLQAEGEAAGQRLVAAAGRLGAPLVRRQVQAVRYGLGLREHPKYLLVRCLGVAREAIRAAAADLAAQGRIDAVDDVWWLRFRELLALVEGADAPDARGLVTERRLEHERFRHLRPPLVVTSEGEVPTAAPPRDLPPGALAGLGASAGVVEGVARVVLDPASEVLHAGEILVAPYTDPGWTPLFVQAAGLVCDVGGMMTHGSVVAREYGIPAVVGVAEGTRRIRTGQRLRVDGSRGIVTVLADEPAGGR